MECDNELPEFARQGQSTVGMYNKMCGTYYNSDARGHSLPLKEAPFNDFTNHSPPDVLHVSLEKEKRMR